jgi:hypothetical protein
VRSVTSGSDAWRVAVGLAGTVTIIILVVAAYYVISLLVLYLGSRLLPLTGRRRRRRFPGDAQGQLGAKVDEK